MIVMKFGGTSVESAAAIARLAGIVKSRASRKPVVVVSAMGKTTNKLLAIAELAARGDRERALNSIAELRDFHVHEAHELIPEGGRREDLDRSVNGLLDELEELTRGISLLGELTPRATDAIASYGERLSSEICALALSQLGVPSVHLD